MEPVEVGQYFVWFFYPKILSRNLFFFGTFFPTPQVTTVQPQISESLLTNFASALEHRVTCIQPSPAASTQPDFQNLPGRRLFSMPRPHPGGIAAFTRRARVIIFAGFHIWWSRTVHHNHGPWSPLHHRSHGGGISLSLLLFLFLSFSLLNFPLLCWLYTPRQLYTPFPICYPLFFPVMILTHLF